MGLNLTTLNTATSTKRVVLRYDVLSAVFLGFPLLLVWLGCNAPCCTPKFPLPVADLPIAQGTACYQTLAASVDPAGGENSESADIDDLSAEFQSIRSASLESATSYNPVSPLGLEEAIDVALVRTPELAAARAGEPVAHAAYHLAQSHPSNPQLQTQLLPYNRDRNGRLGSVNQQYSIVQTFELGGQRQHRVGAAAANWEQVDNTIRQAELMNIAQTTRLYFAALYQREQRDLNQALANLNEQLVGVMQRRMAAGQASSSDVELARMEALSARRRERLAELNYQGALTTLRSHLNFDAGTPLELAGKEVDWQWRPLDEVVGGCVCATSDGADSRPRGEPSDVAVPLSIDEATLRPLIASRPDVMAAHMQVAVALENLNLAQAMKRPDLQIGPMYQRDESATEFWGLQAQIAIPILNTGVPLVNQRIAELHQQEAVAEALEKRAALEAGAAMMRYARARQLVEQSRGEFSRPVAESLRPFEDQFKAGQLSLLQVFAARAALAQSRQSYLDLLNEIALAAADVTQSTGVHPPQMLSEYEPLLVPLEELPKP